MTPSAPLGSTTSIASKFGDKSTRNRRYRLQDAAARLLPDERVSNCGRGLVDRTSTVNIRYSSKTKSACYHNLMLCGSVWMCPVCAAKISELRRVELRGAVHIANFTKVMVTFTLQHSRDDSLKDLVQALNEAFRSLKSGRYWQDMKQDYSLAASVTGTEITWGYESGWHPHKHVLFFSTLSEQDFDENEFKELLIGRYKALLDRSGRYASELYGIDVQFGDDQAMKYVNKWGLVEEVTKASVKNGRGGLSPWQLLEKYQEGDKWAGALFCEYAKTMKGKNQLVWSRGGRDLLGMGAEVSDGELVVDDQADTVLLCALSWEQFKIVTRRGMRGELLDVASSGDPWRLWDYLEKDVGLTPSQDQLNMLVFG